MGRPSMSEYDRRGMAVIRDLHAKAIGSSSHLSGYSGDDTRLRTILHDMDASDPGVMDAWGMLVRAVVLSRGRRHDRQDRHEPQAHVHTHERSLRQQFIDQGFDDNLPPSSRRIGSSGLGRYSATLYSRRTGSGAIEEYGRPARPVLSLRGRERDRDRDRERERERERTDRDHDREGADRDRDTDNLTFRFDASPPDAWELLESLTPAGVPSPRRDEVLDWIETSPTLPPVQPDDAPVLVDVDAEPPTVLERASPPPVVPVRSPSPDESSRAWLAEYASSSQVLGRRRRADSGLARLRLRHPEHGRDTRRDAVVVDTPNWFETIAWSDAAWRGSASGSGSGSGAGPGAGAEVEAEAEGAAQSERPAERRPLPPGIRLDRGMTRTLSLSAVGHGDGGDSDGASAGASASASGTASATAVHERDIAPLPRRGVPRSHTPL